MAKFNWSKVYYQNQSVRYRGSHEDDFLGGLSEEDVEQYDRWAHEKVRDHSNSSKKSSSEKKSSVSQKVVKKTSSSRATKHTEAVTRPQKAFTKTVLVIFNVSRNTLAVIRGSGRPYVLEGEFYANDDLTRYGSFLHADEVYLKLGGNYYSTVLKENSLIAAGRLIQYHFAISHVDPVSMDTSSLARYRQCNTTRYTVDSYLQFMIRGSFFTQKTASVIKQEPTTEVHHENPEENHTKVQQAMKEPINKYTKGELNMMKVPQVKPSKLTGVKNIPINTFAIESNGRPWIRIEMSKVQFHELLNELHKKHEYQYKASITSKEKRLPLESLASYDRFSGVLLCAPETVYAAKIADQSMVTITSTGLKLNIIVRRIYEVNSSEFMSYQIIC